MEIRKADSKGRVTGFEPGVLYAFNRKTGYFSKVVVSVEDKEVKIGDLSWEVE